jgi:two-component system cell cycle response regulator
MAARASSAGTCRLPRPGPFHSLRRPPILRDVDDTAVRGEAEDRIAAHIEALEYDRATGVQTRLEAARELERDADALGATGLVMRARLVRADMLHRAGQTAVGASLAQEVNGWASRTTDRALMARSHLVLSSLYEGIGDSAACLEHALNALELVDESTSPRNRGNYLLRLADALAFDGSFDSARGRYREAQRVFASIGDVERELNVLNNLAYSAHEAGAAAEAWQTADEMRRLAIRGGIELNPEFADTVARALMGVGRHEEARVVASGALGMLESNGDVQAGTPAEVLLTLTEILRRQGRLAEAQEALDRCFAVCATRNLSGVEADALREQAELHAAVGQFELAYETYRRFHARTTSLASARREAAVQTRQVLFETAEARRAAERYWRQARTDPLTGLPNRRFLDEELARRLALVARGGSLVVAIIDADHFKRVNDTLSHAVGDRAIVELASVLEAAVARAARPNDPAPGMVGRLGGEEFLALVAASERAPAGSVLEMVRADVDDHDWTGVAAGLRITVSIGATTANGYDGPGDVLRRADEQLYAAKRFGRNRLSFDQPLGGQRSTRMGRRRHGRRAADTRPERP